MANTTNYNWETPDDTDLVKDGAAAIRTLGNSIDTTTKNLNPETTTGDIAYRSATANVNTRLALGTAGQVLRVNSGATAPEWATASAGALTKITSASFTTQSSVAIDDVFTSTYKRYMVLLDVLASTSVILRLQFRYAGPTTQALDYFGSNFEITRANTQTGNGFVNTTTATLLNTLENTSAQLTMYFSGVGNTSENPSFWFNGFNSGDSQASVLGGGRNYTSRTYTGFLLSPDSGTITGSYQVYGLAN